MFWRALTPNLAVKRDCANKASRSHWRNRDSDHLLEVLLFLI